jgi:hypothetical protein
LLVSHWEVASEAIVKLTTKAIAELKADPKIGRVSMVGWAENGRALADTITSPVLDNRSGAFLFQTNPEFWFETLRLFGTLFGDVLTIAQNIKRMTTTVGTMLR